MLIIFRLHRRTELHYSKSEKIQQGARDRWSVVTKETIAAQDQRRACEQHTLSGD
jgi:hypothetical protein